MKKLFIIFFVLLSISLIYSQTRDTVRIEVWLSKPGSSPVLVGSGMVVEDSIYQFPPKTLSPPFDAYQYYYDAIAGSKFYIEDGALDHSILIRALLEVPPVVPWIIDNKKVWFYAVFEVDGSTGEFFFLNDKAAVFEVPRTALFDSMVTKLGYTPGTTWQFAYYKPGVGFTQVYISTINYSDRVVAKIRHFSEIAGGDQTLSNVDEELLSTSPKNFELKQNYPNPFNPVTTIEYSVQKASNVSLKVFNLLGTEVATLVNGFKSAGTYRIRFDASSAIGGLTSGVYIYKLSAANQTFSKKMILLK